MIQATHYASRKSAPAIMRVISIIIKKVIGAPDILLLRNDRTQIVSSRDEIAISQD